MCVNVVEAVLSITLNYKNRSVPNRALADGIDQLTHRVIVIGNFGGRREIAGYRAPRMIAHHAAGERSHPCGHLSALRGDQSGNEGGHIPTVLALGYTKII